MSDRFIRSQHLPDKTDVLNFVKISACSLVTWGSIKRKRTTLERKSDSLQLDLLFDFPVVITSMYITHTYRITFTYENTVSMKIKLFRTGGVSMNAFGWNCCITCVPQWIFPTFLHEKYRPIHKKSYKMLIQNLIFYKQIKCSCEKKKKNQVISARVPPLST